MQTEKVMANVIRNEGVVTKAELLNLILSVWRDFCHVPKLTRNAAVENPSVS